MIDERGGYITLDPCHDDEQEQIVALLIRSLKRQPVFAADDYRATVAAETIINTLFNELRDAAAYVWLRGEICKTMPDQDHWDGDGAEETVLAEYVQHLAMASHGACYNCERPVKAGERFDAIDNVGRSVPMGSADTAIVVCQECT